MEMYKKIKQLWKLMKTVLNMKDKRMEILKKVKEPYFLRLDLFNIKEIGLTTYSMAKVANLAKQLVITEILGTIKILIN